MYIYDYLVPWMGLNLRELELRIVWIHALYLLSCRRSQYLHTPTASHHSDHLRPF